MTSVDQWLKRYRVRSSAVLAIAIWMLIDAAKWSMGFAANNPREGLEIAAIITAVTGPATLMAVQAFKIFQESRPL